MTSLRVIDTNVLIVASAAEDNSSIPPNATPVNDEGQRKLVLDWLMAFEGNANCHAVLDYRWLILTEYQKKLTDQHYGLRVIFEKRDRGQIVWISIPTDVNGNGMLPDDLAGHVTDREDRKMVAAVMMAQQDGNECKLTNACDTDWLDCEDALSKHNILTEHIIEDWLRALHKKMKAKK